jgi:1,2-diacylglycerol 3-beta-glucosyltransferase
MLTALLGLLAGVLLLPTVSDLISLSLVAMKPRRSRSNATATRPRLLFLVPAHNEELLIDSCVRSLLHLEYPAARFTVLVIADNCTDGTAEIARQAGAVCLERTDPTHPGKPRAIAWALEQWPFAKYDAVVIVDADTVVASDFAAVLATVESLESKAVQGYFSVRNPTETSLTRLGALWSAATHQFAYRLKQRAALNVPLVGNGLCIGTKVLREHGWMAFSIAEDWEMYAELTARGVPTEGAPEAVVYAEEARTLRLSWSQRQRWTAGKLTVLGRLGPQILRSRHIGLRQKLDTIAELSAPGPVLHLGAAVLTMSSALFAGAPGLAIALAASLIRPVVYSAAALRAQPDPAGAVAAVAFLPAYAVWRLVAAAASVTMLGDKPWVRTPRQHDLGSAPDA